MSEKANAAAVVAADLALELLAESREHLPTDAKAAPKNKETADARQKAEEVRSLLELNSTDATTIAEMLRLAQLPGVFEQLGDEDQAIIQALQETSPQAATVSTEPSRTLQPERTRQAAPASHDATAHDTDDTHTGDQEGEEEEETERVASPFDRLGRRGMIRRINEAIAADAAHQVFVDRNIEVTRTHAFNINEAWEQRDNPEAMQQILADTIANALDIRIARNVRGTERATRTAENRVIANRVAERIVNIEANPEPRRGLAALTEGIRNRVARGFRGALDALGRFYNRAVEANAGSVRGVDIVPVVSRENRAQQAVATAPEREFTPEDETRFEAFVEHIRDEKVKKNVAAQLRRLRAENAIPAVDESEEAADAAGALSAEEITQRQHVLERISDAFAYLRDLNFDADLEDEDMALENPQDILALLEILKELNITIDSAKKRKNVRTVDEFMPVAPVVPEDDEEESTDDEDAPEPENDGPQKEKKLSFWQRMQFWKRGERQADDFIDGDNGADLNYIQQELNDGLKKLHPKDKNYKAKRGAYVRAIGLLAQVQAGELVEGDDIPRNHKAINQLRKELAVLGIASRDAEAQAITADTEAQHEAEKAVDGADLPPSKKRWLKDKLKAGWKFVKSPAFLLGAATGIATDILLYVTGADHTWKRGVYVAATACVADGAFSAYTRNKLVNYSRIGGPVGLGAYGLFWLLDKGAQIVGPGNLSKFGAGFFGGYELSHIGHHVYEQYSDAAVHAPVDHDSGSTKAEESPAAHPADTRNSILAATEPRAPKEDHVGPVVPKDDAERDDVDNTQKLEDVPKVDTTANIHQTATSKTETNYDMKAADAAVVRTTGISHEDITRAQVQAQNWAQQIGAWWRNTVTNAQQNAAPGHAKPGETDANAQFIAGLNEKRAGVDVTANVHDGSSTESSGSADHSSSATGGGAEHTGAAGGVEAADLSHVKVVAFDKEHIWADAKAVTGDNGAVTDAVKDATVMLNHAGMNSHEYHQGDQVIVIDSNVHTVADLQALHEAHPEAQGYVFSDTAIGRIAEFYKQAAQTPAEQRTPLQEDIMKHFTGGTSGEELGKHPAAVEALLKIANGEQVDGSKHIIGGEQVAETATAQPAPAAAEAQAAEQDTAKELLDAAVKQYNLDLKHPLAAQGVIDHFMHEVPNTTVDHPERIALFVDNVWGKWVDACHNLNLDPMKANPKIVDYVTNPGYTGGDPLTVSPVRAVMIEYIQHGNSMADLSIVRGASESVTLNLDTVHGLLAKVDDNPLIAQLMANNGVDSAIGQLNIEDIFGNDAADYYKRVQNKQVP